MKSLMHSVVDQDIFTIMRWSPIFFGRTPRELITKCGNEVLVKRPSAWPKAISFAVNHNKMSGDFWAIAMFGMDRLWWELQNRSSHRLSTF